MRLQAKDLRTGNKILKNNEIVTVNNIFGASGLVQLLEEPFQRLPLGVVDITGIPLTEEVLLKCGFLKDYNEYSTNGFCLELFGSQYHYSAGEGLRLSAPIMFIHQLQNLIYSITNEELDIKL